MPAPHSIRTNHLATDGRENAAQHDGTELGQMVANAQAALEDRFGGRGEVYVPQKTGGGKWSWTSDQTFNFVGNDFGLNLCFAPGAEWEYTGTGTALTIKSSDDTGINTDAKSSIVNGKVTANGTDAVLFRIEDSFKTLLQNVEAIVPNGRCVQHANVNRWTEQTMHINCEWRGDIPVEFIPNSAPSSSHETGGAGGTNSFHDTYFYGTQISGSSYGMWLAGVYQYCTMDVTLQTDSSGASLLYLDSERTEATQFDATKFESPADPSDVAAVEYGPNFDPFYGPKFDNAREGFGVTSAVRGGTSNPLPNYRHYQRSHLFDFLGGSNEFRLDKNGSGVWPVLSSPPGGPDEGEWYIDDGTNTSSGNPAIRIYVGSTWVDMN